MQASFYCDRETEENPKTGFYFVAQPRNLIIILTLNPKARREGAERRGDRQGATFSFNLGQINILLNTFPRNSCINASWYGRRVA